MLNFYPFYEKVFPCDECRKIKTAKKKENTGSRSNMKCSLFLIEIKPIFIRLKFYFEEF